MDIGPEDALRRAMEALVDGPGDPRHIDGATVNALQSIAWSLIGLLARGSEKPHEAIVDLVERAGLLREEEMPARR